MITTQCNVRVPPGDVDLVKRMAARLRDDPDFRARLNRLVHSSQEDTELRERVERIEAIIARWQKNVFSIGKGDGK
jgi:hypothetical protein